MAALKHFVDTTLTKGEEPVILMGDFNTYFGFEWPMDLLSHPKGSLETLQYNPCKIPWSKSQGDTSRGDFAPAGDTLTRGTDAANLFLDSFRHLHPAPPELHGERDIFGDTFSNIIIMSLLAGVTLHPMVKTLAGSTFFEWVVAGRAG